MPTIDLVLLSHGDLAHSGLYPYAYARWGLKAPAYSTLPVQAMARIAATEESESIRDEQDVETGHQLNSQPEGEDKAEDSGEKMDESGPSSAVQRKAKYVATPLEVQEAFDSINTLRYSQPTHLQGLFYNNVSSSFQWVHLVLHRQMSRCNYHSFQRWPHSRRDYMENTFPICWDDHVRGQHEPHARATSRRNRAHAPGWRSSARSV